MEADTHEGVAGCLMFAADGVETAGTLASLLGEQGICVTRSVQCDECLDLLGTRRWRLLVIDATGAARNSLDVLSQSRRVCPDVPVLVLVEQGDMETAVQATKAGAADCIGTPITTARLLSAVAALDGQASREAHDPRANLTPVERIVLRHILDGRTNQQIADLLCRSIRTIEVHRCRIMKKLDATKLVELVKQGLRAGMIDSDGGRRQEEARYEGNGHGSDLKVSGTL